MFIVSNASKRLALDAFNLWVGAVIQPKLDFPDGDPVEIYVVTDLIRNADTEEVVVFYRNIMVAEGVRKTFFPDEPPFVPYTTVEVMPYWRTIYVHGNIVNPQDPDDSNTGVV
ncbi:MAG TPA: hypothetical protein VIY48_18145 [Candidatus Paceibacterota bacterium]